MNKAPTKKLKRADKHATLLSRITKSAPGSKVSKRRRPSKKLVTNLEALADALPESASTNARAGGGRVTSGEGGGGKIKHKSLRSRPGAGKRKEKLVAMEMERFGKNMALMSAGSTKPEARKENGDAMAGIEGSQSQEENATKGSSAERWAAVRGFIAQTMEQREDGEAVVRG